MIEIVFGESACGSLKIAQTYGKGKYRGSAVSVFMRHEDGSVPSSDEMKEAQIQAQEQEHIAWENAIPLGGKSSDVYCFDMALSVGDISDNGIGEQRKNVFKKMLSVCFVEDLDYQVEEKIQKIKTTLTSVIERYVAGEEIRIWYSYNPDELCGMYWLMKQLQPLNCQTTIYLVKLPTWEYGKENTMTSKIAWGEVSPGEWGNYITLQEKANPVFLSACAMKWNQLQNENAPLRAMLNGKLQSVSEDIYDSFILREIAEQPEQFKMATVASKGWRIPQGSPSSLWEGVSKFHYPPRCHRARFAESGLRLRRSLGWLFRNHLLEAIVVAAHLMPLSRGFCACIMVYSVFNVQRKASWRMSLHLSPILGHFCTLFSAIREKFFHFLHRRTDALGNILMADAFGCANLINRHPVHEIHPHPAKLRIRQVLPNLRDLSDAAVDCLCPVMRLLHADIHGRNGGRFLG